MLNLFLSAVIRHFALIFILKLLIKVNVNDPLYQNHNKWEKNYYYKKVTKQINFMAFYVHPIWSLLISNILLWRVFFFSLFLPHPTALWLHVDYHPRVIAFPIISWYVTSKESLAYWDCFGISMYGKNVYVLSLNLICQN